MFLLAQITPAQTPPGLPPLPEGPDLSRLRVPTAMDSGGDPWLLFFIGLAALLLIAGIFLWHHRWKKRKTPPPIDPYQAAVAALREARARTLTDDQLAARCAGAVRQLLQQGYNVNQSGLTQDELVAKLPLDPEDKDELRSFFQLCDGVKFAGHTLPTSARESLLATTHNWIERYRPVEGREGQP